MSDEKLSVYDLYQKMSEIGMDGWIADTEGEILKEEIEKVPENGVYLEVGVAYGKSLTTVCYYADKSIDINGIDILNWAERDDNMNKLGVGGRANFIEGDSQQEALSWQKPIDLLFIDANHSYYTVVKDMLSWLPHVKHEGRVMLHDYDETSPGVMKAVHDFVCPHPAYKDFDRSAGKDKSLTIYRFTKR